MRRKIRTDISPERKKKLTVLRKVKEDKESSRHIEPNVAGRLNFIKTKPPDGFAIWWAWFSC